MLVLLTSGFIFGSIMCRVLIMIHLLYKKERQIIRGQAVNYFMIAVFALTSTEIFEYLTLNIELENQAGIDKHEKQPIDVALLQRRLAKIEKRIETIDNKDALQIDFK